MRSACPSSTAGGREDRCGLFAYPPRCVEVDGEVRCSQAGEDDKESGSFIAWLGGLRDAILAPPICGEVPVKGVESLDRVIPRSSDQHDGSAAIEAATDNQGSVELGAR